MAIPIGIAIGAGIAVVSGGVATAVHKHVFEKYHYICNSCGSEFKPKNLTSSMFAFNNFEKRYTLCPTCHKRNWNLTVEDQNHPFCKL
jgi:DNA-directed RNA polymerase subunit RPC12/RpoP